MTLELLDEIIARLPALREQGVTHFTFGDVSMILAPRLPEAPQSGETSEQVAQSSPYNDPTAYGLDPRTPMPRSFRERRATSAPQVK
jgi:hypothetical protein